MTQVTKLEQKWRRTFSLLDDAETPWENIRGLSDQARRLGTELLETPSTDPADLAIKVQWLIEQDLDDEILKEALRCILKDMRRLERQ